MSKRRGKKRRGGAPVRETGAKEPVAPGAAKAAPGLSRPTWRRVLPLGVGLVGGAGLIAVLWLMTRGESGLVTFPPPRAETPVAAPAYEDFVGADACAECHRPQFAAWQASTHGRAGGAPGRETVIAPFDGTPIRFADATVVPSINSDGEYTFAVRQQDREPIVYRVDGVIGRGHMVGGGTQGFVSEFPDGTIRFLPFDFIRDEAVWFCNTGTRTNEGWVPVTAEMRLADCGDWPPIRVLGSEAQLANCQECHGSQITIRFDPEARRYETRVASYGINCESCHGPARDHVERARAGRLDDNAEIGVNAFGIVDKDASLDVCFQCHALKNVIEPGYLPGASLQSHYSLKTAVFGDQPFFPDGRVRTFAYQQNHLYSDCYLNGSMTCVDCHDPHGPGYRDIWGQALESRFSDGQCLSCHPSKADNPTQHTKHPADSPGSNCVACHMPYLQHPELGDQLRFARSDHTIPIPRPTFDEDLGVQTACRNCHPDLGVEALQAQTEAWYGETKPRKEIISALAAVERGEGVDLTRALIESRGRHPIAEVAALDWLLEQQLRPDMQELEPELEEGLRRLAEHADPDLSAVALAVLHYAWGDDPGVRRFLRDRLIALDDDTGDVRKRWVIALGSLADGHMRRGELTRAIRVYDKALEIAPDRPDVLLNRGIAFNRAGDYASAVESFERALVIDPVKPLVYVHLGLALEGQGLVDEAGSAYERAIALDPGQAIAYLNLGNLRLRRDAYLEAIPFYERAVALDPGLALGHYYLARSYLLSNDLEEALGAARRAVEFDPANEGAREMVRDLEAALRGGS